jgi:hypothetical protein
MIDACIHRCGCGGLCDSGCPCPMADNAPPLCPNCLAEYSEDPVAWLEYGEHPAGIANWRSLREEMNRAQEPTPSEAWDGISF